MRTKIAIVVLAAALAGAGAVVAAAESAADGLPAYVNGYAKWTKLNAKPITKPGAHSGIKSVYASKPRMGARFPNGTVVVKSIAEPGAKGKPKQVAIARKVSGRWRWIEFELAGSRYGVLAQGALCSSCHMQAKATDWIFTTR
ncbi:MAG: cytochrome P460 family protein [Gaiella sp.]